MVSYQTQSNPCRCQALTNTDQTRSGAALVELAFVLPVVVLLIVGAIDLGRAIGVQQTLTEAARAGCRLYSLREEVSETEVQAIVDKVMNDAGFTGHTTVLDPLPNVVVAQLDPVTVTVSIPYDQVSLLPRSWFMEGATLDGACRMPADMGVSAAGGAGSGGGPPPGGDPEGEGSGPPPPPPDDDD